MIDLHIHTTATPHHSSWAPDELAAAAAARGLTVIAAADHNTTASVGALRAAGARHGLRVVSGVEIDSAFGGKLWHTLVYGAPPDAPELLALCAAVFARNAEDARRLIGELPSLGFQLDLAANDQRPTTNDQAGLGLDPEPLADLEERSAPGPSPLAQPQRPPNVAEVAESLARCNALPGRVAGEADTEAGMRFLLTQMPGAYRPIGVDEVIAVAHRLGGVAVLAHPGRSKGIYAIPADADDIAAMAAAGLDGVEVYYPSHTPAQRAFLLGQARLHRLLVSGGSDSHHPSDPLASWGEDLVAELLARVG